MFKKLECVALFNERLEESISFYKSMGLKENWRINRTTSENKKYMLVGLKFPHEGSSELVVHNNADIQVTDIEIYVGNVQKAYEEISKEDRVKWIEPPFETESGHVAVMEAPDQNVFVLVGE